MLSDIREQPEILDSLIKKHLPLNKSVQEINLNISEEEINKLSAIYIVASGSSRNAGNVAKYFVEDITRIPVIVDYASEFAHRNPALTKNDLVIAISQSGETADTFLALNVAVEKGAHTFAITNNAESRIYNLAESKMQVGAGKEKSIPATKSFTAQLMSLYILALHIGEKTGKLTGEEIKTLKQNFHSIKPEMQKFLDDTHKNIDSIIPKIKDAKSIVLIGRGTYQGIAQEGALKIKETSYIDANGYPSGEFLHGYVAVLDENIPLISIITPYIDAEHNLSLANTRDIKKKRDPYAILITSSRDNGFGIEKDFSNIDKIIIPEVNKEIYPIFVTVLLQLLAFKIAESLGRDVNNPRSLTKSITSE